MNTAAIQHLIREAEAGRLGAFVCRHGYDGDQFVCLYKDGEGRHCAIGALLPPKILSDMSEDDLAEPITKLWEKKSDIRTVLVERWGFDKYGFEAKSLQNLHDFYTNNGEFDSAGFIEGLHDPLTTGG